MKKIYKVIVVILFALIMLIPASAFAQMSLGSIQNAVTQDETRNCEYISKTVFTPVRITIQYATTPNVTPTISGERGNSQFASDFNNEGFTFSSQESDIWNIKLDIGYESGREPRNYYYELITGNNTQNIESGNWQSTNSEFCKVLVLDAQIEPIILTDEEIARNTAGYLIDSLTLTQEKQDETNDMIAIIVIAVIAVGFTFAVIMVFMKINNSKESNNAILVSKQFATQVNKFREVTKFLMKSDEYRDIKIDYILTEIKKALTDVMHGMNLHNKVVQKQAFTVHAPIVQTESEKITKGLSAFDKITNVFKDQLEIGTKKIDTKSPEYSTWDLKTTNEIYEELQSMGKELSTKYSNDVQFKARYDMIMSIYKMRVEK